MSKEMIFPQIGQIYFAREYYPEKMRRMAKKLRHGGD